jgi:rubrerythrin
MSNTMENLQSAFAGESQANRKYLAFAQKAEEEGYLRAARMFKAAAMAETIHAHKHLAAMGGIGSTAENLKAAVSGETYEFESMYPPMIETASTEGNKAAEQSFRYANAAEKVHAAKYQDVLDNLEKGEAQDFHVCTVCGNVFEGEVPDECPICGSKKQVFQKVD